MFNICNLFRTVTTDQLLNQLSVTISDRDHPAMEKCFNKLKENCDLSARLHSYGKLLSYAYWSHYQSENYYTHQPDFLAMIWLMEEGIRPEVAEYPRLSMFRIAYNRNKLSLLHILMWFESDDCALEEKLCIDSDELIVFRRSLIYQAASQAREDFTEARRLAKLAEEQKQSQAFAEAVANYLAVADYCLKYEVIEREATEVDPRKAPVQQFFQKKVAYCRRQARASLQQIDAAYCMQGEAVAGRHKAVLEQLASQSQLLGDSYNQRAYQARAKRTIVPELTDPGPLVAEDALVLGICAGDSAGDPVIVPAA